MSVNRKKKNPTFTNSGDEYSPHLKPDNLWQQHSEKPRFFQTMYNETDLFLLINI